jgi:hypothetical protein
METGPRLEGANQHGRLPLPKLNFRELALYVADLWLVSDGAIEWVKEPRIRRLWYALFFSTLGFGFTLYLVPVVLEAVLKRSASATLVYRWFMVLGFAWLLGLIALMAWRYYRRLLLTGKDVRFSNIVVFWASWVLVFAYLYDSLYDVAPSFYAFAHPPFVPQSTYSYVGLLGMRAFLNFLLYSASTTVTLSVPGLSSSSFLVSALNLVEVIGSVLLGAILVATFVNQSTASAK